MYNVLLTLAIVRNAKNTFETAIENEIVFISKAREQARSPVLSNPSSTTKDLIEYMEKFVSNLDEYVRKHSGAALWYCIVVDFANSGLKYTIFLEETQNIIKVFEYRAYESVHFDFCRS